MTFEEFNKKWELHLEYGHYGLAIGDSNVIAYLDAKFEQLEKDFPLFTYSQIKMKFSHPRVYMDGVNEDIPYEIESRIADMLNPVKL